ncbi:hypothetical protein BUALT_Bualt02G0074200 [Buddleja alternifolia]|uniref:BHLH domain-containing protein n=1 Tax=Buddleja alternifolia TaxID=168488 RepID=A0AAV6Y6S9_9LAMI|nr:hypothetical protein BUALT_Bualt02G0074200 [Buddleja alternifolia]
MTGGYLKTHDFLQPLERVGKKDENKVGLIAVEKPPIPAPLPPSVEHILPGGIGTYSISYLNQRALKPDGALFTTAQASSTTRNDENSNSSSYTGSGFTLWDESAAVIKGKTGKENVASAERNVLRGKFANVICQSEAGGNIVGGQWMSVLERPSQSSSNHKHNSATFSSFSSSQPSSSHMNQSFMDLITSAKNDQEEEDDDDDEEFINILTANLSVKVEAKTIDQKPNTPRSKHSATEQRRRSKINDRHYSVSCRFQKLREIVPNSDQKRDKASFLLEVIEYIQFLQEKANRCESPYNLWNHEPSKMMQWRNHHIAEGFIDNTREANTESGPATVFTTKFDENKAVTPNVPINGQNLVDSDISSATTLKERVRQPDLTSKATAVIHPPMQPNVFSYGRTSIASDPDKTMTRPPSQVRSTIKDQELAIESGTINISTVYSQGLLNTLTQALQSSGVDLSQASISVQIDLGKRANDIPNSSTSTAKDDDLPATLPRPRVANKGEEYGQALKRLRTS